MQYGVWVSLGAYFILMLAIGFYAWRKSTSSSSEYLLGGRGLGPAVTALSAGASDMSGWLLLGLPGALFLVGVQAAWIGIGLWVGALVNWVIVAPRLREQTERYNDSLTIPAFLSNRFPSRAVALRTVSAVIVVVFFIVYTASGLVAGGKLFEMAFSDLFTLGGLSPYQTGVWLSLFIVLIYTTIGGFLAVSLTDFVQGTIMMLALIVMPLFILYGHGGEGVAGATATLGGITDVSNFLNWTDGLTFIAWLSAVTWGLGYFGQPHIIVRFMAIRSVKAVPTARNIGMAWMFISLAGAIGVGIFGRAYAMRNGLDVSDPETIFIILAELLFNPFITGFLYAALLAAVMSTISSQLLVSSSSLTEDMYHLFMNKNATDKQCVTVGRISVVAVGIIAGIIAIDPTSSVLGLVSHAWAGFGAAFGPLIVLSLMWKKMSGSGAIAGLVVGALTVIIWNLFGWSSDFFGLGGVYEIIPGFILSWAAIYFVSLNTYVDGEFRAVEATS